MKHTVAALFVTLLATSACGGKSSGDTTPPPSEPPPSEPSPASEPAAPAAQSDDAIIESMISITAEVGAAAIAQQPDCTKMAAAADAVVAKRKAEIAQVKALMVEMQNDEARGEAFVTKYSKQLVVASKDLGAANEQCQGDPAWKAMVARFN